MHCNSVLFYSFLKNFQISLLSTILLLSNILETSDLLVMLNLLPQSLVATEKQERKSGKMVVF